MGQLLQEFKHTYSLTSDWRQNFVDGLGCTIVNENMYFPEETAVGSCCISEINPDVSVVIIECVMNKPLRLTRVPSEDDFWIVYYDLSDSNSKHIVDDVNHKIGYKSKLNFAIVDNKINSTYLSTAGEQFYALRLFIRKSYMKTFFNDAEFKKDFKDVFDSKKENVLLRTYRQSKQSSIEYFKTAGN